MTFPAIEKINITKLEIRFPFSENGEVDCSRVFSTFADASAHLAASATLAPRRGEGYDKTDVVITVNGGFTYQGRMDLQSDDADTCDVARHVVKFGEYVCREYPKFAEAGYFSKEKARDRMIAAVWWTEVVVTATKSEMDAMRAELSDLEAKRLNMDANGQTGWSF